MEKVRLTEKVKKAGWAAKIGPEDLDQIVKELPIPNNLFYFFLKRDRLLMALPSPENTKTKQKKPCKVDRNRNVRRGLPIKNKFGQRQQSIRDHENKSSDSGYGMDIRHDGEQSHEGDHHKINKNRYQ